jgi:hypothetical protein
LVADRVAAGGTGAELGEAAQDDLEAAVLRHYSIGKQHTGAYQRGSTQQQPLMHDPVLHSHPKGHLFYFKARASRPSFICGDLSAVSVNQLMTWESTWNRVTSAEIGILLLKIHLAVIAAMLADPCGFFGRARDSRY